jgi:transcriptional regulator with XRE-family HTH domain
MAKADSVLIAFGNSVKKRREAKGLTQELLAEKADLDRTYVSDIERGLRNPGIKNVARLAKALGLTTSELCKGVDA